MYHMTYIVYYKQLSVFKNTLKNGAKREKHRNKLLVSTFSSYRATIIIHLQSCLFPPDEFKSNIQSVLALIWSQSTSEKNICHVFVAGGVQRVFQRFVAETAADCFEYFFDSAFPDHYGDSNNNPPCQNLSLTFRLLLTPFMWLHNAVIQSPDQMHQTICFNAPNMEQMQWLSPCPELLYIHSCLKASSSTSRSGQPCCYIP